MAVELAPVLVEALEEIFGLPRAQLVPGAHLEDDLQLDSLSLVELQVVLEDETGVRMPADDPDALRTLADLQRSLDAALERGEPAVPSLDLSDPAA